MGTRHGGEIWALRIGCLCFAGRLSHSFIQKAASRGTRLMLALIQMAGIVFQWEVSVIAVFGAGFMNFAGFRALQQIQRHLAEATRRNPHDSQT
jgi:hypothetical protein